MYLADRVDGLVLQAVQELFILIRSRWVAENRPDMPLLREEVQPGCDGQDLAFLRRLAEGAL